MSTADVQQATSSPSLNNLRVTPEPRPDLNGLLVHKPGDGRIYLIDRGLRRYIPNFNLFKAGRVAYQFDTKTIEEGSPVHTDAILIKDHRPPVYLVDVNPKGSNKPVKRHIVSLDVLARYQFDAKRVEQRPATEVDAIPTGEDVVMPTEES